MRELFVYYRVRADDAEAALAAVRAMQARLIEQQPGLVARLLRRPETSAGTQTWMETYAIDAGHASHAPDGIGTELQSAIEVGAAALLPLLDGPRHTEVFIGWAR